MKDGELCVVQATEQLGESVAGIASVVVRYYNELAKSSIPPLLVDSLVRAFHALLIEVLVGRPIGYGDDDDND